MKDLLKETEPRFFTVFYDSKDGGVDYTKFEMKDSVIDYLNCNKLTGWFVFGPEGYIVCDGKNEENRYLNPGDYFEQCYLEFKTNIQNDERILH